MMDRSSQDGVFVATSEQSLNDLNVAAAAEDVVGWKKVILSGGAFFAKSPTHARLIGYGHGILGLTVSHVRIVGGEHADADGWVPHQWLIKK